MDITIIGTGNMARGIGTRAIAGGHDVTVLGRERADAEAVVSDIGADGARAGESGDDISGDVVVLAVYFPDAQEAVARYGSALDGKVLIDITNPVNESLDGLVTAPDGSAAQELAKQAPGARVVKAFNTTFAGTLTEGQVDGRPLDVFIAGDDDGAKASVTELVESGGLRAVDTGPLARARELEGMGLVHMGIQGTLGTGFASALKLLS